MEGNVKFYNAQKGFGFIIPSDGSPDIYIGSRSLGDVHITEGDKVAFDVRQAKRGPEAINVRRLSV